MQNLPHPVARLLIDSFEVKLKTEFAPIKNNFTNLKNFKSKRGSFDLFPMLNGLIIGFADNFCAERSVANYLCEITILLICGLNKNASETDKNILQTHFSRIAHSVSIKQFLHYFQSYKSGLFRMFDFQERNIEVYNSTSPPEYPLSNVIAPVYIYSGSCDLLVAEADIALLSRVLPNVRKYKNFENFNHW